MGRTCSKHSGIKLQEMFSPGSSTRRWEDNIKINFREIFCEGEYWIELVQNRAQIKGKEMGGTCSTHEADKKLYHILAEMPERV
jgi:hypothetical protein